jgi:hypothetical protein
MKFRRRTSFGLLLLGLTGAGGCSVQDADQPAIGSISAGARKDTLAPKTAPAKTKTAPPSRQ